MNKKTIFTIMILCLLFIANIVSATTIGNTASIFTTATNLTYNQTSGKGFTGFVSDVRFSYATSGVVDSIIPVLGRGYNDRGNVSFVHGIRGEAISNTNTLTPNLYGVLGLIKNTGSGNVTHAIGLKINPPENTGGGTIERYYGVYITDYNNAADGGSALHIAGQGTENSISWSGNNGSGRNSRLYSDSPARMIWNLSTLDIQGYLNVSNDLVAKSYISVNSKVGNLPSNPLIVNTNSNTTDKYTTETVLMIKNLNSTTANQACIGFRSDYAAGTLDANSKICGQATGSGSKMYFRTTADYASGANQIVLMLDPTGKVGINTTSPTNRLDIADSSIRIRDELTCSGNCNAGTIGWNSTNICVCVATNTWKVATLS